MDFFNFLLLQIPVEIVFFIDFQKMKSFIIFLLNVDEVRRKKKLVITKKIKFQIVT